MSVRQPANSHTCRSVGEEHLPASLEHDPLLKGCVLLSFNIPVPARFLPQAMQMLPEYTEFFEKIWRRRPEFHVTLVGFGHQFPTKVASTHGISREEAVIKISSSAEEAAKNIRFFVRPSHELRHLHRQRDNRESIILMCEVDGAKDFLQHLNTALGTDLILSPTHITLYILGNESIGVTNHEELNQYTQNIYHHD